MEADVAVELEALRAEVAALKDMAANWRVNGLDKLVQGRGATAQLGSAPTSGSRTLRTGNWRATVADMYETPGTNVEIFDIFYQAPPATYTANSYDKYAFLRGHSGAAGAQTNLVMGCNEQLLASPNTIKTLIDQLVDSTTCAITLDAEYGTGIAQNSVKLVLNGVANTIAFTGPKVGMDSLALNGATSDPAVYLADGDVWYRSDTDQFGFRINGVTYYMSAATFTTLATDTLWDAKGDLAVGTAADTAARLAVGANGAILMAASGEATGLKWQATPAARYIPLPLTAADDARTGVRVVTAYDAHGSLSRYGPHVDNADADATFKQLRWAGIHVPADFASGMTLKFLYSSSVASNNAVFAAGARETLTGATGHTTSLNEGANGLLTLACPGVANTLAVGSVVFDVAPTAGRSLMVGIDINTNHANDSNTGTKTVWDAWLEYTPTL